MVVAAHDSYLINLAAPDQTIAEKSVAAFADEYGVEKEAPTLATGETVEVSEFFTSFVAGVMQPAM